MRTPRGGCLVCQLSDIPSHDLVAHLNGKKHKKNAQKHAQKAGAILSHSDMPTSGPITSSLPTPLPTTSSGQAMVATDMQESKITMTTQTGRSSEMPTVQIREALRLAMRNQDRNALRAAIDAARERSMHADVKHCSNILNSPLFGMSSKSGLNLPVESSASLHTCVADPAASVIGPPPVSSLLPLASCTEGTQLSALGPPPLPLPLPPRGSSLPYTLSHAALTVLGSPPMPTPQSMAAIPVPQWQPVVAAATEAEDSVSAENVPAPSALSGRKNSHRVHDKHP